MDTNMSFKIRSITCLIRAIGTGKWFFTSMGAIVIREMGTIGTSEGTARTVVEFGNFSVVDDYVSRSSDFSSSGHSHVITQPDL